LFCAAGISVAGVRIGQVLAYAAGRLMASNLFGVVRLEPVTFVSLAVVLGTISLVAAYIPARKALSVDPAVVLRAE
jgi:putative ABC transport system permease protein